MTQPVIRIDTNSSALDAAKLMVDHNIRNLLVIDQNKAIGIITQDEVLQIKGKRFTETYVKDLASSTLLRTFDSHEDCEDAIKMMILAGTRKLVIVDTTEIVGLLSLSGIITST